VEVPRHAGGDVAIPIEISPLFALDAEELRANFKGLDAVAGPLLVENPKSETRNPKQIPITKPEIPNVPK
jgi:hypothetical protein